MGLTSPPPPALSSQREGKLSEALSLAVRDVFPVSTSPREPTEKVYIYFKIIEYFISDVKNCIIANTGSQEAFMHAHVRDCLSCKVAFKGASRRRRGGNDIESKKETSHLLPSRSQSRLSQDLSASTEPYLPITLMVPFFTRMS
jgi:hypothetical protein